MTLHIMAFIFYTCAMLGIIFVAFVVYKNVVLGQTGVHNSKLKIDDMLRLNQRKSLYVINYENEKFLIASDVDSTTFLAKLNEKPKMPQMQKIEPEIQIIEENTTSLEDKLYELKNASGANSKNVMRNILKELNSKKERF